MVVDMERWNLGMAKMKITALVKAAFPVLAIDVRN